MEYINGGICAPKGFKANGLHCGIRKNKEKKDLALIISEVPCAAAAVYTRNKVFGAPIKVTKENLLNGKAQAVICNSGNANTCNANGVEIALGMCDLVAQHTGISAEDVIVASTGVIGQNLDIAPMAAKMGELVDGLNCDGSDTAANAIMTTDTVKKEFAIKFNLGGQECRIGAIAKGSGMIHPNMATMLSFITTDVAITAPMLHSALREAIEDTVNMVSVDGDTSTNDTMSIMANGLAGNPLIDGEGGCYNEFLYALKDILTKIAKELAKDGEGATKLIECRVTGARNKEIARVIAKSVITSSLLKAAMFAADANWGRILCAIGYADADFDIEKVDVSLESSKGVIEVCKGGSGVEFSEDEAKKILLEDEIIINVNIGDAKSYATAWGCDLTYDYVRINADYRS